MRVRGRQRGAIGVLVAIALSALLLTLAPSVSAGPVGESTCAGFSIDTLRATHIRRATPIRCSLVRRLLRGTYDGGGYRHTYPFHASSGRPIVWFHGGWRCSTGAGGAGCTNALHPRLNAVDVGTAEVAITAATG